MSVDTLLLVLTVICAVGSAAVGGALFAFSSFVMPAFDRAGGRTAIAAMQAVNRTAPTGWFVFSLVGTAVASVLLIIFTLIGLPDPAAAYRLAAGVLYLAVIVITGAYHIPRNNALDMADPAGSDADRVWSDFAPGWKRWNHVRTVAPLAATALLVLAARFG